MVIYTNTGYEKDMYIFVDLISLTLFLNKKKKNNNNNNDDIQYTGETNID